MLDNDKEAIQTLQERFNVSRETISRFELYQEILIEWSRTINLVGRQTIDQYWKRHVLDSLGLLQCMTVPVDRWLDLGSGSGFPLIPIAIMNLKYRISDHFIAIDSDQRKVAFLMEVRRQLGLDIEILSGRIESVKPCNASIISARALASVGQILKHSEPHASQRTNILLLKGERVFDELTEASRNWHMSYQTKVNSLTRRGHILGIDEFVRA